MQRAMASEAEASRDARAKVKGLTRCYEPRANTGFSWGGRAKNRNNKDLPPPPKISFFGRGDRTPKTPKCELKSGNQACQGKGKRQTQM